MKFACDKCRAKYSISDDRVRDKVLKIRCKKCKSVIIVKDPGRREDTAAQSPIQTQKNRGIQQQATQRSRGLQAKPKSSQGIQFSSVSSTQEGHTERTMVARIPTSWFRKARDAGERPTWFMAINHQPTGPVVFSEVMARIQSGELTPDTLVWNAGWPDWVAAGTRPELDKCFNQVSSAYGYEPDIATPPPLHSSRQSYTQQPSHYTSNAPAHEHQPTQRQQGLQGSGVFVRRGGRGGPSGRQDHEPTTRHHGFESDSGIQARSNAPAPAQGGGIFGNLLSDAQNTLRQQEIQAELEMNSKPRNVAQPRGSEPSGNLLGMLLGAPGAIDRGEKLPEVTQHHIVRPDFSKLVSEPERLGEALGDDNDAETLSPLSVQPASTGGDVFSTIEMRPPPEALIDEPEDDELSVDFTPQAKDYSESADAVTEAPKVALDDAPIPEPVSPPEDVEKAPVEAAPAVISEPEQPQLVEPVEEPSAPEAVEEPLSALAEPVPVEAAPEPVLPKLEPEVPVVEIKPEKPVLSDPLSLFGGSKAKTKEEKAPDPFADVPLFGSEPLGGLFGKEEAPKDNLSGSSILGDLAPESPAKGSFLDDLGIGKPAEPEVPAPVEPEPEPIAEPVEEPEVAAEAEVAEKAEAVEEAAPEMPAPLSFSIPAPPTAPPAKEEVLPVLDTTEALSDMQVADAGLDFPKAPEPLAGLTFPPVENPSLVPPLDAAGISPEESTGDASPLEVRSVLMPRASEPTLPQDLLDLAAEVVKKKPEDEGSPEAKAPDSVFDAPVDTTLREEPAGLDAPLPPPPTGILAAEPAPIAVPASEPLAELPDAPAELSDPFAAFAKGESIPEPPAAVEDEVAPTFAPPTGFGELIPPVESPFDAPQQESAQSALDEPFPLVAPAGDGELAPPALVPPTLEPPSGISGDLEPPSVAPLDDFQPPPLGEPGTELPPALPSLEDAFSDGAEAGFFADEAGDWFGTQANHAKDDHSLIEVMLPPLPPMMEEEEEEEFLDEIDDADIIEIRSTLKDKGSQRMVIFGGIGVLALMGVLFFFMPKTETEKKKGFNKDYIVGGGGSSKKLSAKEEQRRRELLGLGPKESRIRKAKKKARKRRGGGGKVRIARVRSRRTRIKSSTAAEKALMARLMGGGSGIGGGSVSNRFKRLKGFNTKGRIKAISGGEGVDRELLEKIYKEIARNRRRVGMCYSQYLKRTTVEGRMVTRFWVKSNGRVKKVKILSGKFRRTRIAKCIKRVMKTWRFTPFTGRSHLKLEVPYLFKISG